MLMSVPTLAKHHVVQKHPRLEHVIHIALDARMRRLSFLISPWLMHSSLLIFFLCGRRLT